MSGRIFVKRQIAGVTLRLTKRDWVAVVVLCVVVIGFCSVLGFTSGRVVAALVTPSAPEMPGTFSNLMRQDPIPVNSMPLLARGTGSPALRASSDGCDGSEELCTTVSTPSPAQAMKTLADLVKAKKDTYYKLKVQLVEDDVSNAFEKKE